MISARAVLLLGLALASPAGAADTLLGTWTGRYWCAQGETALSLTIAPGETADTVAALFHFYPAASNPGVPEGCFRMAGTYDEPTRQLTLQAGEWLLQPDGYETVDLTGTLDAGGQRLAGHIDNPLCTTFELRHVGLRVADPATACRHGAAITLR